MPRANRHALVSVALAGALLATGAPTASAQAPSKPSKQFLDAYNKGIDAFRLGNYDEARAQFDRAVAIDATLPGTYRWLTFLEIAEEKWEGCLTQAFTYVKLAGDTPDATEVREAHAQCRENLRRQPFREDFRDGGAIAVIAGLDGVSVSINGLRYGATPFEPRSMAPGEHEVKLERQGYLTVTRTVAVVRGLVTDVVVELERDPDAPPDPGLLEGTHKEVTVGWVTLRVAAPGAAITFDGAPATFDGRGRIEADPGTYEVVVAAPGHETWRRRVRIHRGQNRTIEVSVRSVDARAAERRNGYLALGAAGALAASGAAFAILESRVNKDAQDLWRTETSRPTGSLEQTGMIAPVRTREDLDDLRSRGKTYALLSHASYGLAAAAFGASVYFFLRERQADRDGFPAPIAIVPIVPGPGGAGEAGVGATVTYTRQVRW
jgi:hypothetical protein